MSVIANSGPTGLRNKRDGGIRTFHLPPDATTICGIAGIREREAFDLIGQDRHGNVIFILVVRWDMIWGALPLPNDVAIVQGVGAKEVVQRIRLKAGLASGKVVEVH